MSTLLDFIASGDVVNPILSAVLVDSGALSSGNDSGFGIYKLQVHLNCSVVGSFEVGIFNNDDTVSKTFRASSLANSHQFFELDKVQVNDGQKIKVRSGILIIGTVNVALAYHLISY